MLGKLCQILLLLGFVRYANAYLVESDRKIQGDPTVRNETIGINRTIKSEMKGLSSIEIISLIIFIVAYIILLNGIFYYYHKISTRRNSINELEIII